MKRILICLLVLSQSVAVLAQDDCWIVRQLKSLATYIDSSTVSGVDTHYLEVPKQPWQVIFQTKLNGVDVKMDSHLGSEELKRYGLEPEDRLDWRTHIKPSTATSMGLWVGYRGFGLSYSFSLIKNAGRYFALGTTGVSFGLNMRYRRFEASRMGIHIKGNDAESGPFEWDEIDAETWEPMTVKSTYINGYYLFNGRRFSQAAAYDQSVIQRRSAGSLMLGATWYQSSLDYSERNNAGFVQMAGGIGRIKFHQFNIGLGYGYNWVPARGWLLNAMVMPTLSVYNRIKTYTYDSNYNMLMGMDDTSLPIEGYGKWNSEIRSWENGEKYRPVTDEEAETAKWQDDVDLWVSDTDIKYDWPQLNIDLRASITYNWNRYFICANGQFNRFEYSHQGTEVKLLDWYAQVALGVRF